VKNSFGESDTVRPSGSLIWVHAASIGEAVAALTYIRHVKESREDLNVLLTTCTVTSADIVRPKLEKIPGCVHQFVVADNPAWIEKFLDSWRPSAAFFLESEIWPNTVDALHCRTIPIYLLNAGLSRRSFERWKKVDTLLTETLRKFSCIFARSDADLERFEYFSPLNTVRADNLKYAGTKLPCNEELAEIFRNICAGKKILVAASTHEKEEEIIAAAHVMLKEKFDVMTVIIPRHLSGVKRVGAAAQKRNLSCFFRSELSGKPEEYLSADSKKSCDICCVDTFGEVGTFLRAADVCFVGGSLTPIGGHNLYEPVALGKAVLHGPYTEKIAEMRDFLKAEKLAFEVKNAHDICEICTQIFSDEKLRQEISEKALSVTKNNALSQIDSVVKFE
jgi:3-deoxy-D-manno-octulosonic-acid transferase